LASTGSEKAAESFAATVDLPEAGIPANTMISMIFLRLPLIGFIITQEIPKSKKYI
jgi:hypothetical protein